MPTFRYQAEQPNGIPVFGTVEADNEQSVRQLLAARQLKVLQCEAVSLNDAMRVQSQSLPRLHQLRVGERIREAFLTGLPAHTAVRAMAAEPFEHPLLAVMPLACAVAGLSVLPALGWRLLLPDSNLPLYIASVFAVVIVPLIWLVAHLRLDVRPRRLLLQLADRLEHGHHTALQISHGLPVEVQAVLQSDVDDRRKALAVAELVPSLMGSRFHLHRLLQSLAGSLALVLVIGLGFYWAMWQIVPQFQAMFSDFGIDLPFFTEAVLQLSRVFVTMGLTGFVACSAAAAALLLVLFTGLSGGRLTELVSHAPLLGIPFRWLMQARVARVLAAMLTYDCDRSSALRAATVASDWRSVRSTGERLAVALQKGEGLPSEPSQLSGLPLSLLELQARPDQGLSASNSVSIAQSFEIIAGMLEQSSHGQGRFLGMLLQMAVTLLAGLLMGVITLSMFLPLIKLMNDLS